MSNTFTHGEWRVRQGATEEFIAAWKALAAAFSSLDRRPLWGSLIQSESDPQLFYSFGPWVDPADISAMRADANAQLAMRRVVELCERATPGAYRLIAHVDLQNA